MRLLIFLSVLFISINANAQEIEILNQADSLPNIKERGLKFIHTETNLDEFYKVGSVEISSDDYNKILIGLQSVSNDLFANAFKYQGHHNEENKTTVKFDLFSVSLKDLGPNNNYRETNVIYFLGNDNKPQKFKINKEKIILKPDEIYRFELPKEEEVKINKGGFTGMTIYHSWKENQPVLFYAFGSGKSSSVGNGYSTIGLQFNTGKIFQLKSDYAFLFMELKKQK